MGTPAFAHVRTQCTREGASVAALREDRQAPSARLGVAGWRSQYAYHFCDGYKTLSGHISLTKMLHNENSPAIERGAAPQLKSDEFLLWIIFVSEIWPLKVLYPSQK